MKTFADFGIVLGPGGTGQVYAQCPQCSKDRKKKNSKPLSVNTVEGIWNCHHCNWTGSIRQGQERASRPNDWKPKVYRRPELKRAPITTPASAFFQARGIDGMVVALYQVSSVTRYFPQLEAEVEAIAFPYIRDGEVLNAKYRALTEKAFTQEWDAEKIVFGMQEVLETETSCIVTEGEMDVLAFATAGIAGAVSVPDGAPPANSKPSEKKFEYLVNCQAFFDRMKKIVLAVDSDAPGKALEQELGRRLGVERCWRVQWPEDCKDANDVLLKHGPNELHVILDSAKPWPIEDVVYPGDLSADLLSLRDQREARGLSTGWPSVDELYTVLPGELTIVTGIPGHGKSEFIDALALNLAKQHSWSAAFCSPENLPVTRHLTKMLEKQTGEPFYDKGPRARMTEMDMLDALEFLHQYICLIVPEESLTIETLLSKAKGLVFQRGICGLVLDPWNEFDHRRAPGLSETEHVSASLGLLRRFARNNGVHVWVVAHPAKLQKNMDDKYPVPRPYDISGSAHWYNRADNCLSIWRDMADEQKRNQVEIHVQKIRNKHVGTIGMTTLVWDYISGRFNDQGGTA